MYKEAIRSVWAEINLTNADYNIKQIKKKVGEDKEIIGVLKADGYGHGAVKMAEVLRENGVKSFAVATLQECIALREAGAMEEIIMLGLTPDIYADTIVQYNITPTVNSWENAKAFSDEAKNNGVEVRGFVAVDTGMGRIGYLPDDERAIGDIKKMEKLSNFSVKGLLSHFARADERDKSFSEAQVKLYEDLPQPK